MEKITLGGGCFWCLEAVFQKMEGVASAVSGYAGGKIKNPTYREVCSGLTGHAEVVQVTYDPAVVSFGDLLAVFFQVHDPTTPNRQGNDVGTQYRSAVFYHTDEQKQKVQTYIEQIEAEKLYPAPVVTQLAPLDVFYPAEEEHKDYFVNNPNQPYCTFVVKPKVDKFKKLFADKVKVNS